MGLPRAVGKVGFAQQQNKRFICVQDREVNPPPIFDRQRSQRLPVMPKTPKHLTKYGLTVSAFNEMLTAQGGKCALSSDICDGPLCVDHKRKQIRGLLCATHNKLLGSYEALVNDGADIDNYLAGKLTKFTTTARLASLPICYANGCFEAAFAKGLCHKHYDRMLRPRLGSQFGRIT